MYISYLCSPSSFTSCAIIRSSHLPGILGVSSKGECAVKESIVPPVQCEDTATVHTAKFKISAAVSSNNSSK